MSAFLVMLREGVEGALIVAILLSYLDRTRQRGGAVWVWLGTGSAVAVSLLVGMALWYTVGGLEGTAEQVTEGVVAAVAAALLTWMIFWMGHRSQDMRSQLLSRADAALEAGSATALALVPFVAVLREGVESALFMISTTLGSAGSGSQLGGGLLGLVVATAIGYLFYRGSHLVDLRVFFRVTGILLILFAAGLVSTGIHEMQEAGVLPTFAEHLWQVQAFDPDTSLAGRWLASLFGWSPEPSLLMVVGYLAYMVPVGSAFVRLTSSLAPARPRGAGLSRQGST